MTLERAWSYALSLLSRRDYTEAEIRERLTRKKAATETIDEIVARLERYRLVDDEAFANSYVESRSKQKGSLAISRELARKGVAEDLAEQALAPLSEDQELQTAVALLTRNAWRFTRPDARRNRSRAFSFLARRGFPPETVIEAIESCHWIGDPEQESNEA